MRLILAASALLLAAACTKELPPEPAPPPEASAAEAGETPAAPFAIGAVADTDAAIQGCQVMLTRVGADPAEGYVFYAAGADQPPAEAYIRIDAALMKLALISAEHDENTKTGFRTFEDADKVVTVVETLKVGEAHEASDSVEQTGQLDVTYNGETQTIEVEGGTAC